MEYNLEDIYILKEDMDFLKRGESRKIRERKDYMSPHIRKQYEKLDVRSNYTSKNSISNKSINKIIYALAKLLFLNYNYIVKKITWSYQIRIHVARLLKMLSTILIILILNRL
ncbi:Uncharacterised protein [Acinetobacter baumannii]|nr:Uncharacterised protein [Acinetobacter baumannii]